MKSTRSYNHLWQLPYAIVLFVLLTCLVYPYYRYYIDPDAVAYLTMARRYATGDIMGAVNGLWSPFHPWLVAICIKNGMDALFAAHITNGVACVMILSLVFALFRRFKVDGAITFAFMTSLPVFLCYCLFKQLFDDLWQVVFLLFYLSVIFSSGFVHTKWKWLLCGLFGALAFYAKTYSFYFIVLHLPISIFLLQGGERRQWKRVIRPYAVVLVVMMLLMSPWVYLMHKKYGKWTLSNAGAINQSWTLVGRKTFNPEIRHLIPPPYPDSPCNMEDPYFNESHYYKPWESPKLFAMQIVRSALAVAQGLYVINEISVLLLAVLLVSGYFMFFRRKAPPHFSSEHRILMFVCMIMPLGYALLHFEGRYIWMLGYAGMLLGAHWLMFLKGRTTNRLTWLIMVWVFALSYLPFAIGDMKLLFKEGEDTYKQAQQINLLDVKGSFTSNQPPKTPILATAYLTNCQYYTIEYPDFSKKELLEEMKRYGVKYYFFYHQPFDAPSVMFTDERGVSYPELTHGSISGLKIFEVNP